MFVSLICQNHRCRKSLHRLPTFRKYCRSLNKCEMDAEIGGRRISRRAGPALFLRAMASWRRRRRPIGWIERFPVTADGGGELWPAVMLRNAVPAAAAQVPPSGQFPSSSNQRRQATWLGRTETDWKNERHCVHMMRRKLAVDLSNFPNGGAAVFILTDRCVLDHFRLPALQAVYTLPIIYPFPTPAENILGYL